MSAFPESGRSSYPKTDEMKGRFRPIAAVQVGKFSSLLDRTVREAQRLPYQ
jgi:hypothetical protein